MITDTAHSECSRLKTQPRGTFQRGLLKRWPQLFYTNFLFFLLRHHDRSGPRDQQNRINTKATSKAPVVRADQCHIFRLSFSGSPVTLASFRPNAQPPRQKLHGLLDNVPPGYTSRRTNKIACFTLHTAPINANSSQQSTEYSGKKQKNNTEKTFKLFTSPKFHADTPKQRFFLPSFFSKSTSIVLSESRRHSVVCSHRPFHSPSFCNWLISLNTRHCVSDGLFHTQMHYWPAGHIIGAAAALIGSSPSSTSPSSTGVPARPASFTSLLDSVRDLLPPLPGSPDESSWVRSSRDLFPGAAPSSFSTAGAPPPEPSLGLIGGVGVCFFFRKSG